MATCQEIINDGLHALRVLGFGQTATSAQSEYCLGRLQAYIDQLSGFGGSLPFVARKVTGSETLSTRYPAQRLQCQLSAAATITLPEGAGSSPIPDGMRVQIVDAKENFATYNLTVAGNGFLINSSTSNYTISTNGAVRNLMFRADLGDWQVMSASLALGDNIPFPSEFDEAIMLNAARRYTRFGQRLSAEDMELARKGANRLRARYVKPPNAQLDTAVASIGNTRGPVQTLNDFLNGIES